MIVSRHHLAVFYAVVGVVALVLTWSQILGYLDQSFLAANAAFWGDALGGGNGAQNFLVIDLLFLALVASVWMVFEARRMSIPFVWAYVVGGLLVAISLTFPLFLAVRERRLAADGAPRAGWTRFDAAGLGLMVLGNVGTVALAMGWSAA